MIKAIKIRETFIDNYQRIVQFYFLKIIINRRFFVIKLFKNKFRKKFYKFYRV